MKKVSDKKISYAKLYMVMLEMNGESIIKAGFTARSTDERFKELRRKNKATSFVELDTFAVAPYYTGDELSKEQAKARAKVAETAMHNAMVAAGFTPVTDKQDGITEYYRITSDVGEIQFSWKVRKTLTATMKVKA